MWPGWTVMVRGNVEGGSARKRREERKYNRFFMCDQKLDTTYETKYNVPGC